MKLNKIYLIIICIVLLFYFLYNKCDGFSIGIDDRVSDIYDELYLCESNVDCNENEQCMGLPEGKECIEISISIDATRLATRLATITGEREVNYSIKPLLDIVSQRQMGDSYDKRIHNKNTFKTECEKITNLNIKNLDDINIEYPPAFYDMLNQYDFDVDLLSEENKWTFFINILEEIKLELRTDFLRNIWMQLLGIEITESYSMQTCKTNDSIFILFQKMNGNYIYTCNRIYYSMLAFNYDIGPKLKSIYGFKIGKMYHFIIEYEKLQEFPPKLEEITDKSITDSVHKMYNSWLRVKKIMDALNIIHGDFHMANIVYSDKLNNWIMIDWETANEEEDSKYKSGDKWPPTPKRLDQEYYNSEEDIIIMELFYEKLILFNNSLRI